MYLRCSAGSVEWIYPTGALIVNLRPNTFAPSRHLTLCIKPLPDSSGANIYLEKTGELQLLVRDGEPGPGRARCFGLERGGLFVEATPQQGIGRRSAGFQYELSGRRPGRDLHAPSGEWAPGASVLLGQIDPPHRPAAQPLRTPPPPVCAPGRWVRRRGTRGAADGPSWGPPCGVAASHAWRPLRSARIWDFAAHVRLREVCLQRATVPGVAVGQGKAGQVVVLAPMGPSPLDWS